MPKKHTIYQASVGVAILLRITYATQLRLRQGDRCPITGDYGLDASLDFIQSRQGSQTAPMFHNRLRLYGIPRMGPTPT